LPNTNAPTHIFTHTHTQIHTVFEDQDFDGYAVDMWGCGIILFILLAGVPPLELPTLSDPRYRMIATGRLNELLDIWSLRLSTEARDLLSRLLQPVPENRATLAQVMQHRWVTG
jgi:serine/threonine protein kinase